MPIHLRLFAVAAAVSVQAKIGRPMSGMSSLLRSLPMRRPTPAAGINKCIEKSVSVAVILPAASGCLEHQLQRNLGFFLVSFWGIVLSGPASLKI